MVTGQLPAQSDRQVRLPLSPSPISQFDEGGLYDILSISDNRMGVLQSLFEKRDCDGRIIEIDRYRTGAQSTINIQLPLFYKDTLQEWYNNDCLFPILVTESLPDCDDCWISAELYTGVQLNNPQQSNIAGCSTSGEPLMNITAIYNDVFTIENKEILIHEEPDTAPIDITYCDKKECSACCGGLTSGCDHVYGLFATMFGYVIGESVDGGNDFNTIANIPSGYQPCSILCHGDRLLVGTADNQDGNLLIYGQQTLELINTVTIEAEQVQIQELVVSGQLVYALGSTFDAWILAVSENIGDAWTRVHIQSPSQAYDLGVSHTSWIVSTDTGIVINGEFYAYDNAGIALSVAMNSPDFRHKNCTIAFMFFDGKLYADIAHNQGDPEWRVLFNTGITNAESANIITFAGGSIVWLIVRDDDGIIRVYKYVGDRQCLEIDIFNDVEPNCTLPPDNVIACFEGDGCNLLSCDDQLIVLDDDCVVASIECEFECRVYYTWDICPNDINQVLIVYGSMLNAV